MVPAYPAAIVLPSPGRLHCGYGSEHLRWAVPADPALQFAPLRLISLDHAIIDLPRRCRQYLKCPRPDLDFVPFGQEPGRLYLFTVDEGAVPAAVDQEGPIGRGYHARVAAGHFVARQNDVALGKPADRIGRPSSAHPRSPCASTKGEGDCMGSQHEVG